NLPLVTSGDAKNKVPGAIGQAGTTVLFGNAPVGYRTASGMRLTLGAWVDAERSLGVEGSGFLLERRANDFTVASNGTGNPLIAIPFVNQTGQAATESARLISNPQKTTGDVLVAASMQRWGGEFSGIYSLWRRPGCEVSLLIGMRYEDLQEELRLLQHSFALAAGTNTTFDDRFSTRNQFCGGQIAVRFHGQYDIWVFEATPKIALGNTHEVVEIQGASSQFGPRASPAGSFPGGFFAQPSNIGRMTANRFAAIPSFEAGIAYLAPPPLP